MAVKLRTINDATLALPPAVTVSAAVMSLECKEFHITVDEPRANVMLAAGYTPEVFATTTEVDPPVLATAIFNDPTVPDPASLVMVLAPAPLKTTEFATVMIPVTPRVFEAVIAPVTPSVPPTFALDVTFAVDIVVRPATPKVLARLAAPVTAKVLDRVAAPATPRVVPTLTAPVVFALPVMLTFDDNVDIPVTLRLADRVVTPVTPNVLARVTAPATPNVPPTLAFEVTFAVDIVVKPVTLRVLEAVIAPVTPTVFVKVAAPDTDRVPFAVVLFAVNDPRTDSPVPEKVKLALSTIRPLVEVYDTLPLVKLLTERLEATVASFV